MAGDAPGLLPRLDGRELAGIPVQLYRRQVFGVDVLGLWVGGEAVYDVTVYDASGRSLGVIEPEGSATRETYDRLRRSLVAELIHA